MIPSLLLSLVLSPTDLPALQPGMAAKAAASALEKAGFGPVRSVRASEPQGLGTGLLRSHLLATLNALSSAPKQDGAFDPRAFTEFQLASRQGQSWVLAFGPSKSGPSVLRYALLELAVPIDKSEDRTGEPSLRRLHPLKDALLGLSSAGVTLAPKLRDRYGNTFRWHGAKGAAIADVWYLPEADRLRVLLAY